MLKYEQEVVTTLKSQLIDSLDLLKDLKIKSYESLASDPHLIGSAKYNLIVAVEAAIDICNHLISKNGFRVPDSYSDSFKVLAEKGILNYDFANTKLYAMAIFHNRLVHHYWAIDLDLLYEILQNSLTDLEQFLDQIKQQL